MPNQVNVPKRSEFGCGELNGRWWIIVKHDASVPRDYVVKVTVRSKYLDNLLEQCQMSN